MPSTTSARAQAAPQPSDDEEVFTDAPAEQGSRDSPNTTTKFRELIKRKNTYAKKRITMAEKYLTTLEGRQSASFREMDANMLDQHVKSVEKAIQAVVEIVDSSNHLMSPEEIDAYLNLADEHMPRVSDIHARTGVINDHVKHNTTLPPLPNQQPQPVTSSSKKIDKTFCPEPLDEDATPDMFDRWLKQFRVFIDYNNLKNAPIEQQRLLIHMCLTTRMANTLDRVCSADAATSMDQIIAKLEAFVLKTTNLMTRRYKFFNCIQNQNETIKQYIIRFRGIGDYANFEGLTYDEMMACRLVTGVKDEALRRELLRLPKSDFDSVNDFATAWETSHYNAAQYASSDAQPIAKISAYKADKKKVFRDNLQNSGPQSGLASHVNQNAARHQSSFVPSESHPCRNCGLTAHPPNGCQAKGQQCAFCKILGHYARVCKKKQRAQARGSARGVRALEDGQDQVQDMISSTPLPDSDEEDHAVSTIFSITAPQLPKPSRPTPKIVASFSTKDKHIGNAWILPDTGAAVSVLPQSLVQSWNILRDVTSITTPLKSVDGSSVACYGSIALSVEIQESKVDVFFFVCPGVKTVIMSWHALLQVGIIPRYFPNVDVDFLSIRQVRPIHYLEPSIKREIIATYPKVFSTSVQLGCMSGEPMHIYLKASIDWPNIKQVYKPRPIPIALRQATKEELDLMIAKDIIMPVTAPTTFTSPLVVVPKKANKVRLVVDYTELNKYVRRPVHPFPSVSEVKTMIPPSAKFFATLDALQGYWQIPLESDSQLLTTFITPWGRFCYKRAPMGLASSGDEFCRRGDLAFKDITGVIKVVDDLLIYASTEQELKATLHSVMKAAEKAGITLSSEKFNVGTSVNFIGLNITSEGIRPDPRHMQAISQFPTPKNRTDLRSFLGLVNQFGSFSNSIAALSKTLRPLLSQASDWQWTNIHSDAFDLLKNTLSQSPVLKYFNPNLQTRLVTDASKLNGLGFALLQAHPKGWALIACGSRYITPTEANYAIIELEALAIAWAVSKCRIYLMGLQQFQVITDHRPLVSIFNSSRLAHSENPRLFRIMQQVTAYNFTVLWTPGRLHSIPDALSRAPVTVAGIDDLQGGEMIRDIDPALRDLIRSSKDCPQYASFRDSLAGLTLSQVKKLPADTHGHVRAFLSVWPRLSLDKQTGLILLDNHKIFVPKNYRHQLLTLAHASHQGVTRTKARLQALYFWQGMSNDIVQLLQACDLCQKFQNSQPEQPLKSHSVPNAPFRSVSTDLFDYNGSYTLTLVDRFSGYPLVAHYNKSPTSLQLINTMSSFFKDFGLPCRIRHDGARPFVSSQFKEFMQKHNIQDELSSAYNPRSNGHAEASVKTIKTLVKKCWKNRQLDIIAFNNSLLEWRNTPHHPANLSPAQLLFGRNLRTLLPAVTYNTVSHSEIKKAVQYNYAYIKDTYQSFNSRKNHLRPLSVNDHVRIQDPVSKLWSKTGVITEVRPGGLSYFVQCQGKSYLRNRKYLKKYFGAFK